MSRNMTRREALATFAGLGFAGVLSACGNSGSDGSDSSSSAKKASSKKKSEDVVVRVASLKGPTTIGLVQMMNSTTGIPESGASLPASNKAKAGSGVTYAYSISAAPDEILPLVIQGKVDIACVPSNVGSVLYNKTNGKIKVIDLNTLGVLSVVTGDSSVKKFKDLAGKTVYISGKGSSPEYVLNYLLDKAGIKDQVTLEWKSEHTEVAAVLAKDSSAVGVLPQPFTTATLVQVPELKAPIDLTDVWKKYAKDGSQFVMGTTIVRSEFADEYPGAVQDFLERHAKSVKTVKADPSGTASLVVKAGIVAKEAIAKKAIPECNVVCITGKQMKKGLEGYLKVLYKADKTSVGGALPADDFYYLGE
ncbi:MAG: ABC transporter substrate-binding protein [Olsenella sp.]|jgi:NitT/TauT family transport system substrate-binding protein|nr:ABC transporter substrate-binding protein [Olsenella sp.]MCI1288667.1 ABC transporter substrate-binding protein [Olsenella sp.]